MQPQLASNRFKQATFASENARVGLCVAPQNESLPENGPPIPRLDLFVRTVVSVFSSDAHCECITVLTAAVAWPGRVMDRDFHSAHPQCTIVRLWVMCDDAAMSNRDNRIAEIKRRSDVLNEKASLFYSSTTFARWKSCPAKHSSFLMKNQSGSIGIRS